MSSKRWTIVCLTLTLLIFGCSDAEVVKVKEPLSSGPVGNTAAMSSWTVSGSQPIPTSPPRLDVQERLAVPPNFQPPVQNPPTKHHVPFDGDPQLPPLPGFEGMADVPVHFPGRGDVGSPTAPIELLGPGRDGERLRLPPEMPGFELPGFEGGPGAELRRLRQPGTVPTPVKDYEARQAVSG